LHKKSILIEPLRLRRPMALHKKSILIEPLRLRRLMLCTKSQFRLNRCGFAA